MATLRSAIPEVRMKHATRAALALLFAAGFVAEAGAAAAKPGTLADALQILQGKEFVDLTHSFSPTSPVWGGFGQATMSAASDPKTHRPYTIEKDGYRSIVYTMVGQYGTHIDP